MVARGPRQILFVLEGSVIFILCICLVELVLLWTHAQRCVHVIFCRCFLFYFIYFMAALVGQTAERIFTKLSHVVDIRCYLRTY